MKNIFSRMFALAPIVMVAMVLGIVKPAAAAVVTFNFGDLLSETGPDDSSIWGTLSVTTNPATSYDYTFLLGLNSNFSTLFGNGAYVSTAIFNTPTGTDPTSAAISIGSWGVEGVKIEPGVPNVGGLGFNFGYCLGAINPQNGNCKSSNDTPSGRLQAGESVSWTTHFTGSQGDPLNFNTVPVGLHVQSIDSEDPQAESSAWYGVTAPVPEPETYAMLLAGLGLVAFSARRRLNNNA